MLPGFSAAYARLYNFQPIHPLTNLKPNSRLLLYAFRHTSIYFKEDDNEKSQGLVKLTLKGQEFMLWISLCRAYDTKGSQASNDVLYANNKQWAELCKTNYTFSRWQRALH
jgi:hypothetical protein